MSQHNALDLSSLGQFRASELVGGADGVAEPSAAVHVLLSSIDLDPKQPRRQFNRSSLEELSESIRQLGVLEPVSLRRHPDRPGRYIVNRGERRVRAAGLCELSAIPAFIDERVDPYAQAAENLHREDMSALDVARFIFEREQEGDSRSEIARRLAKPRSFITEAATLNEASPALMAAVRSGHVAEDVRTLYRMVLMEREQPTLVDAVLKGAEPIHRNNLESLLRQARGEHVVMESKPSSAKAASSAGRTVLIVEHDGRRGALRLRASDDELGEVRFGDDTRSKLPLSALKVVCWATEDSKW